MPGEGVYTGPCAGLPQPNGIITTPSAILFPSGLNTTLLTLSVCSVKVSMRLPDATFHNPEGLIIPHRCDFISIGTKRYVSNRIRMPGKGVYQSSCAGGPQPEEVSPSIAGCPGNSRYGRASHNRTVLSLLPVAIVLPSGLNATLLTHRVCPIRVRLSVSVWTSHSRTVLSPLPLAIVFPSGLNATLKTISVCPVRACMRSPV